MLGIESLAVSVPNLGYPPDQWVYEFPYLAGLGPKMEVLNRTLSPQANCLVKVALTIPYTNLVIP